MAYFGYTSPPPIDGPLFGESLATNPSLSSG